MREARTDDDIYTESVRIFLSEIYLFDIHDWFFRSKFYLLNFICALSA